MLAGFLKGHPPPLGSIRLRPDQPVVAHPRVPGVQRARGCRSRAPQGVPCACTAHFPPRALNAGDRLPSRILSHTVSQPVGFFPEEHYKS